MRALSSLQLAAALHAACQSEPLVRPLPSVRRSSEGQDARKARSASAVRGESVGSNESRAGAGTRPAVMAGGGPEGAGVGVAPGVGVGVGTGVGAGRVGRGVEGTGLAAGAGRPPPSGMTVQPASASAAQSGAATRRCMVRKRRRRWKVIRPAPRPALSPRPSPRAASWDRGCARRAQTSTVPRSARHRPASRQSWRRPCPW